MLERHGVVSGRWWASNRPSTPCLIQPTQSILPVSWIDFTLALMLGTSVRTVPHCAGAARPFWGDLVTSFSQLNSHKVSGPDGLKGRTLKNCAAQIGKILTLFFNYSILGRYASCLEDFHNDTCARESHTPSTEWLRPCCSHPIIAKCFEKTVSKHLKFDVVDQLDPF